MLDSTEQEKARGITIKASSIKILAPVPQPCLWQSLCEPRHAPPEFHDESSARSDDDSEEASSQRVMLYVANLPRGYNDAPALQTSLEAAGLAVASLQIRRQRGFAWVELQAGSDLQQACQTINQVHIDGHQLVAQVAGQSARQRLRALCQLKGYSAPVYDLYEDSAGKHARVTVVIDDSQTIEACSTQELASFKLGKEDAASKCLTLLEHDINNHDSDAHEDKHNNTMTLNLVDCPGHIDFNSEVTAALRMADGAMVVVDVLDGVCAQTRTVLRQALLEGVKPVLVLNKFDRLLLELRQTPEEVTTTVLSAINDTNMLIKEALGSDDAIGPDGTSWTVSLIDGSVVLGSGYFSWLCSFDQMLELVARERNPAVTISELCEFAKAVKAAATVSPLKMREAVEAMMIRPLLRIHRCIEKQERTLMEDRLRAWGFTFDLADWDLPWKKQLKKALGAILPASQCMLRLFMQHLPAPHDSQRYRMPFLCQWMRMKGPHDRNSESSSNEEEDVEDETKQEVHEESREILSNALLRCDPTGPLMLFIVKMVPLPPQNKHLVAIGRVYSGTVRAGDILHVADGSSSSVHSSSVRVTRLVAFETPNRLTNMDTCQAGDVCGFMGIDAAVIKSATLCSQPGSKLCFNPLPFTVTPVVSVSIRPKRTEQISKFTDAMRVITKTDPGAHFHTHPETGEHLLSGVGELHLEVLVTSVQELSNGSLELDVSDPIITFRETVTSHCTPCLTKSVNKHNRLYFTAQPLEPALVDALEAGEFDPAANPQERTRRLVSQYHWDAQHAKKVLAFGPDDTGPNVLVDATTGLANLSTIKDSLIAAFQQVTMSGPVAGQRLRGVRIDLVDAVIHGDNVHKRAAQIVPAASRGMQAAVLASSPCISEPLYELSVEAPQGLVKEVCSVVNQRRGQIQVVESSLDQSMTRVEAYLPVKDSLGLTGELRGATSGKVNVSLMTAGWQGVGSDPLEPGTPANLLVLQLRSSKKMSPAIPRAVDLVDRL